MFLLLNDVHSRLGAQFATQFGREVPLDYGDAAAEHLAVRQAAGIVDRSDRGKITVSGPDRVAFLQAIVSNDVEKLAPGEGRYALLLNVKGQVQAEFPVYQLGERFLLTVEPGERAFTFTTLRRFKLRSKVDLKDETEAFAQLSLHGPASSAILRDWLGETLDLAEYASAIRTVAGAEIVIAGSRALGEIGYELYVPVDAASAVWDGLLTAGAAHGLRPAGRRAWESLRIEAGTPRYGPELNESMLPPEARLEPKALDYEKGCYPGQEIMARIRFRAHVNRFLMGLVIEGSDPPAPGSVLQAEGKDIGRVTSAAFSPVLKQPIALAYVRKEQPAGAIVALSDGRTARVTELPFEGVRDRDN